jgi:hypothetical protein
MSQLIIGQVLKLIKESGDIIKNGDGQWKKIDGKMN